MSINSLPHDLLFQIFYRLDKESRPSIAPCCKKWKEIFQDPFENIARFANQSYTCQAYFPDGHPRKLWMQIRDADVYLIGEMHTIESDQKNNADLVHQLWKFHSTLWVEKIKKNPEAAYKSNQIQFVKESIRKQARGWDIDYSDTIKKAGDETKKIVIMARHVLNLINFTEDTLKFNEVSTVLVNEFCLSVPTVVPQISIPKDMPFGLAMLATIKLTQTTCIKTFLEQVIQKSDFQSSSLHAFLKKQHSERAVSYADEIEGSIQAGNQPIVLSGEAHMSKSTAFGPHDDTAYKHELDLLKEKKIACLTFLNGKTSTFEKDAAQGLEDKDVENFYSELLRMAKRISEAPFFKIAQMNHEQKKQVLFSGEIFSAGYAIFSIIKQVLETELNKLK